VSFPVLRSPLVIVSQAHDTFTSRAVVDLASAVLHQIVGFPVGWGIRTVGDRAMREVGVESRVDLEVNDTTTLLDLVEAGLGIAVVPDAVAQLRPSLGKAAISEGTWQWIIAAQTIAPRAMNPAGRALWDMLTSERSNR
jgi:DNA-binding transcriptional LysR family regulator